uniref:TapB family protein n=1 Tax=uncultured Eudoraea sp. TaxID=1035614 RepID=UPI0026314F57
TSYNGKGKNQGTISYTVTNVIDEGSTSSATMVMTYMDDKGKEAFTSEFTYSCTGNIVTIDYESLMSNQMLQQFDDMEMEVSGTDIELPNDLEVGQELPDANIIMKISMSGMNMNSTMDMVNRKVEKQESVTTPAGTFDCYVIYSENQSKMMMVNQNFPSRLWLAKDVGMVKQESFNKNGKLMTSTVLTNRTQ